jgi:transposase
MVDRYLTKSTMKKEQIMDLRKKVKFYVKMGLKNTDIAKKLNVSRKFVIKWKKIKNYAQDKRGWEKGLKRKFTDKQETLVITKRKELENDFFLAQRLFLINWMTKVLHVIL